jgi:predicted phosphate transport protein (TIGR00153 family)
MSLNSIFQYFVPKDTKVFFPLFEQAASNVLAMARKFDEAINTVSPEAREDMYVQIDKLESVGDELTHRIYTELSKNFITPFDREDIAALASAIDDVADYINGSSGRMTLYKIYEVTEPIKKLSTMIVESSIELDKAIKELRKLHNASTVADACVRMSAIAHAADDVFDRAVADLFLKEKNAINLIKYKEVLANLETATDKCDDVGNILETILIKNA